MGAGGGGNGSTPKRAAPAPTSPLPCPPAWVWAALRRLIPRGPPPTWAASAVNASTWRMHKLGQPISPLEVALNGSQAQHAVGDEGLTVESADGRHRLRIM